MTKKENAVVYERELRDVVDPLGYDSIRAAGSEGTLDLVLWARNHDRHILAQVKSTKKGVYYTSSNKEEYDIMRKYARAGHECYYFVRWTDGTREQKWEVFDPIIQDIMKKGEGVSVEEILQGIDYADPRKTDGTN